LRHNTEGALADKLNPLPKETTEDAASRLQQGMQLSDLAVL
jgi:hypothetical protein